MAALELTTDQIIRLIEQLTVAEKYAVLSALQADIAQLQALPDTETQEWLEAPLVDELPPYDWGETGIPEGKPVCYVPNQGFVVEGGKSVV